MITLVAALALAAVAVGILAGSLVAQPSPRVYKACDSVRVKIEASVLPEVVDQDLCPVAGRTIEDHGAATVVPKPGESVFSEAMSPEGNQQLVVINPPGDRLLLREVGSEGAQEEFDTLATRAGSPAACSDRTITPGACA